METQTIAGYNINDIHPNHRVLFKVCKICLKNLEITKYASRSHFRKREGKRVITFMNECKKCHYKVHKKKCLKAKQHDKDIKTKTTPKPFPETVEEFKIGGFDARIIHPKHRVLFRTCKTCCQNKPIKSYPVNKVINIKGETVIYFKTVCCDCANKNFKERYKNSPSIKKSMREASRNYQARMREAYKIMKEIKGEI